MANMANRMADATDPSRVWLCHVGAINLRPAPTYPTFVSTVLIIYAKSQPDAHQLALQRARHEYYAPEHGGWFSVEIDVSDLQPAIPSGAFDFENETDVDLFPRGSF